MDFITVRTAIQGSKVFEGFDQAHLGLMLMIADIKDFSSGEIIYSKGQESEGVFGMIVSGSVGVVAESGQVLKELGGGEVIGEVGTISPQQRRTLTVKTTEPTTMLEWQIGEIQDKLPELVDRLKDVAWRRIAGWLE